MLLGIRRHGTRKLLGPKWLQLIVCASLFLLSGSSFLCVCVCVCVLAISWASLRVYGGSQARGRIGAIAASLPQSHSDVGLEPRLQFTPQLMATPDS